MDIKPWPVEKDYTFPSAWVDASGATVDDGSYLDEGLYERAMKEAYAVRLKHLIDACGDEGGHKPDKDQTCFICKALAEIGELP
jgi:hypothetical protein